MTDRAVPAAPVENHTNARLRNRSIGIERISGRKTSARNPDKFPLIRKRVNKHIAPVATLIFKHVIASTTNDLVIASAARNYIVTIIPRDRIVTSPTRHTVPTRAANHIVIAVRSNYNIVAAIARYRVIAQAAIAKIIA